MGTNIAWKAAAGLALSDEAFHHTVLVLWRAKLNASADKDRIFKAVRAVMDASGVIKGKTRRALDSTVLDDAVIRQDTIDMLVAQIRRVRKLIPELEGVPVHDYNLVGPGRPPCDWDDRADVDRLISELVDDANELVWAGEDLVEAGLELTDRPRRWPCWHWWPARTSSPAMSRAGGGSRSAPRRIGSSPPSTRVPACA